jgi:hypothetical protein
MWPLRLGLIQTSLQAGGTAIERIHASVSASRMRRPSASAYTKSSSARRRLIPGSPSLT